MSTQEQDQNTLGDYEDDVNDGVFKYSRMGTLSPLQKFRSLGKIPLSILFVAQVILPVIIIILQVVTMIMNSQTATASCGNTLGSTSGLTSQNVTCFDKNNMSGLLQEVNDITHSSSDRLTGIVRTLSNLETGSATTKGAVDDILLVVEDLLELHNKTAIFTSHVPVSCQDIKNLEPDSPSGYYHINSQLVYCRMGEVCGTSGGWTRIAYLDMTDSATKCPTGLRYYHNGDVRACGRPAGGASCVSVKFPSNGISYSEACGRVTGYQRGSPDAADNQYINSTAHNDINSYYIDGVSITYGYPRQHVWSFMAGYSETVINLGSCPCNTNSTQKVQAFVGNDYFCESGNKAGGFKKSLYTADPLWDGKDCTSFEVSCCDAPGMPWFHKTFDKTTEYMELRVCGDEPVNANEDSPVSLYEIYVK